MSINSTALSGRLAADPELRYTPAGKAVCSFRIAVQRNFKNEAGEYEADFFACSAWEHSAKFLSEYAQQGDLLGVVGRLQNHSYQHQEFPIKIVSTQVQCSSVEILAKKGQNADGSQIERREGQQRRPASNQGAPPVAGQANTRSAPPPVTSNADEFDDDDIDPFADE